MKKWKVTVEIEKAVWHKPEKRTECIDIPPGTYNCKEQIVEVAGGVQQTWLVITEGEYEGCGAWIDSLKSKTKPAKDHRREDVGYYTLEPQESELTGSENGSHPPDE